MTSQEKSPKKSAKFNYLAGDSIKQELLGRYESLNFSPNLCKKNYETTSIEKNKQNMRQNTNNNTANTFKVSNKNVSSSFNSVNTQLNHRLVSFSKNRPDEKNEHFKQKQMQFSQKQWDQVQQRKDISNNQHAKRLRNKSFGNFSIKRQQLENTDGVKNKRNIVEFSPYREEINYMNQDDKQSAKKTKSRDASSYYYDRTSGSHQNLLIYEMEEQQLIVRKQLRQYQYQNELLRQKIQYLQSDNCQLKQLTENQAIAIDKLDEQILKLNAERQKLQVKITEDRYLISDLEHSVSSLALQVKDFQIILSAKEQIIIELRNKIERTQVENINLYQPQVSKRRKSLDLSIKGRKTEDHQCTTNIGRLMNKTVNYPSNQRQDSKTIQKQLNFIQSIKSMYLKITSKQAKDLKQLWKWLKSIAHQYQSFTPIYTMSDPIFAVLDDFETRNESRDTQKELSFMDKECFKIIKKLAEIVTKTHI